MYDWNCDYCREPHFNSCPRVAKAGERKLCPTCKSEPIAIEIHDKRFNNNIKIEDTSSETTPDAQVDCYEHTHKFNFGDFIKNAEIEKLNSLHWLTYIELDETNKKIDPYAIRVLTNKLVEQANPILESATYISNRRKDSSITSDDILQAESLLSQDIEDIVSITKHKDFVYFAEEQKSMCSAWSDDDSNKRKHINNDYDRQIENCNSEVHHLPKKHVRR